MEDGSDSELPATMNYDEAEPLPEEPEEQPPPPAPNWEPVIVETVIEDDESVGEPPPPSPEMEDVKLPALHDDDDDDDNDEPPTVDCDPWEAVSPPELLPGFRANDAAPEDPQEAIRVTETRDAISGTYRRKSLMQPQRLAARILPREEYERLSVFASEGCPAECGPPWEAEVIEAARRAGPHDSACTPDNVDLIWEDITYQQEAGFVRIVSETQLFRGESVPKELKISRVAVVPQANRRGRIILNLSAQVDLGVQRATGRRRWKKRIHPSVNETTQDAAEQEAVKALGTALSSLLLFMFETNSAWEIDWQKIDLSDGFWRMITEHGRDYNFVFQLPKRQGDTEHHYVVPSSLQMGWKNSPAFFCTGTEATRELVRRLLALTLASGIDV